MTSPYLGSRVLDLVLTFYNTRFEVSKGSKYTAHVKVRRLLMRIGIKIRAAFQGNMEIRVIKVHGVGPKLKLSRFRDYDGLKVTARVRIRGCGCMA